MKLKIVPITFRELCNFIDIHHRHHRPPQGYKFGIAAELNGKIVGVCSVGRPVARLLDNGSTCEVTRLCTDGTKNACSLLYSSARRIAFEMGYIKVITYILENESGISLRAAGWIMLTKNAGGGSWTRSTRKRNDKSPTCTKQLWFSLKQGAYPITDQKWEEVK